MTSADTAEQGALSFLTQLIERAQKAGADAADAVAFDGEIGRAARRERV